MKVVAISLPGVDAQARPDRHEASVPLGAVMGALFGLFALDNVLLLGFLGYSFPLVLGLTLILPAMFGLLAAHALADGPSVSLRTLALCFAIALLLLMLGGEGRLLYATEDWQIRDAVLRDMGTHRWPFDYWLEGRSQVLRAPLGMYLVPALLGAGSQVGRDWALLAHNGMVLGLLLAAGSALFQDRRGRIVALVIFTLFSGLDVIGNLLRAVLAGTADWDHLERWANNHQYSAHITQIFWVPQHAFAGWTCALAYLLWRRGLAPISIFGAAIPLVALWSPLAIMGAIPFAILAGVTVLLGRTWGARDVLLCGLAILMAVPALLYLQADAVAVGEGFWPPVPAVYAMILLLEVVPFLLPLLCDPSPQRDRATLLVIGCCLFLMPAVAIGQGGDFQMRASIMPLALLALFFAEWVLRLEHPRLKVIAIILLSLGSVTGAAETARALRLDSSPPPRCSLVGVWNRQSGDAARYAAYFADRHALPSALAPGAPVDRVATIEPDRCWERPWRSDGRRT